jgi:hypothetical protein
MLRYRIWLTSLLLLGALAFLPHAAQSTQTFDADLKFQPMSGTNWHYFTTIFLWGDEIRTGHTDRVGGIIWTVYDETVNSSGSGLVSFSTRFNLYEALDLGFASQFENPSGGSFGSPSYGEPANPDGEAWPGGVHPMERFFGGPEPMQSAGGGGGGTEPGGGDHLQGEGEFDITPIMESNIRYVMSESGRILDISGLELIGEIIDPSRSITVRQLFETVHFVVLPDYRVHLNESWRAPMSWTIPYVGETMEIPLTFTLSDIRTTYRFRVAAIDFSGILQFDVDTMDEGLLPDEQGDFKEYRKESNIQGDIIIQGRAYVDFNRGVLVAICDTPALGNTYFLDGIRRGNEPRSDDLGLPWPLNPGFYATMKMERRDLYTPLENVLDPRQDVVYRIQELQWFTTTILE